MHDPRLSLGGNIDGERRILPAPVGPPPTLHGAEKASPSQVVGRDRQLVANVGRIVGSRSAPIVIGPGAARRRRDGAALATPSRRCGSSTVIGGGAMKRMKRS